MHTITSCPGCGHPIADDAPQCARCDLILPSRVVAVTAPDATPPPATQLYSKGHILRATFLGSLLAGTHLLASNWKRLGHRNKARCTWLIGVLAFVPILTISILITDDSARAYMLPMLLSLGVADRLFRRQAEPLAAAHRTGAASASSWTSLAIPLAYLAGLLLCMVVAGCVGANHGARPVTLLPSPQKGGSVDNVLPVPPRTAQVEVPPPVIPVTPPKLAWTPGQRHPTLPHLTAHSVEGQWVADAGYRFPRPGESLAVEWTPGLAHPNAPHVVAGPRENAWRPEQGYGWIAPDDPKSLAVRWSPGKGHPSIPHITSHTIEGQWLADPGYRFPKPTETLAVQWTPGVPHPNFPHIVSYTEEGRWAADPGYRFPKPSESLVVEWTPGLVHPTAPHITAGTTEGRWTTEPGYSWVAPDDPKSLAVRWTPGGVHPSRQHVVAGTQEGDWVPADGCEWPAGTGSLHAVPKTQVRQRNWAAAITKILGASVLNGVSEEAAKSQPKSEEGLVEALLKGFLKEAVKEGANYGRRELVRSAVADVFPELSDRSIDAVTNLVDLSLDRRVTFSNWQAATTRDELVRRLRQEDPSMANAQEAAEFIGKLMDASLSRASNR
jgi:hypothetical protein